MRYSRVLMWRRKGRKKREDREVCWMYLVMDRISEGEPSPPAHPFSSKSHPLSLRLSLSLSMSRLSSVSIRMQQTPKMLSSWRWILLDKYRLFPVCVQAEFSGDHCRPTGPRGFRLPLYVNISVDECWHGRGD